LAKEYKEGSSSNQTFINLKSG